MKQQRVYLLIVVNDGVLGVYLTKVEALKALLDDVAFSGYLPSDYGVIETEIGNSKVWKVYKVKSFVVDDSLIYKLVLDDDEEDDGIDY